MGFGPFDSEIFPMMVVLKQLETAATAAAAGYDDVLREPVLTDGDADNIGEKPAALYGSEVNVPAQLERQSLEALTMGSGGNLPMSTVMVSFSRGRLESLSLMDSDGRPKIKPGDRMVRLEDMAGNVMWTLDQPPEGLVLEEIVLSDAYLGGRSNWFLATFKSRKVGPTL